MSERNADGRIVMSDDEILEISEDSEVKRIEEQLNEEAAPLRLNFKVQRTYNNSGSACEIAWSDNLRGSVTGLWEIPSKEDARGVLRILRQVMKAAATRDPDDVEDEAVASAREKANKLFVLVGAISLAALAWALLKFFNTPSPQPIHVFFVSAAGVTLAWCSNEWRLTHRKNTKPIDRETSWWAYWTNGICRLPLTASPAAIALVVLVYTNGRS